MRCCFLYNMCMRNYKKKPWTMKEKGLLTDQEFSDAKEKLLS